MRVRVGVVEVPVGVRARVLRQSEHVRGGAELAERGARGRVRQARHHLPNRGAQRQGLRTGHPGQVASR